MIKSVTSWKGVNKDEKCIKSLRSEHSRKVNKFFIGVYEYQLHLMMSSNGGLQGGITAYLVNSKSNCEFCMVSRDLLFDSHTSHGLKINEIREFLSKNFLIRFLYGF